MTAHLDRLVADIIDTADFDRRADFELLADFTRRRDARAFEALVRRHGPAVLATCRKVLSGADADDAFQAAFVALLRHAPHVRTAVGGWLITVAHRIAVRMRSAAQRRAAVEANHPGPAGDVRDPSWREACAVLHQELDALPDAYRRPLVLCYLTGLTRDEAATELGMTAEAVKGRLERGRLRLRRKLERRGIALSAGLLAAAVAEPASAAVPARLVRAATTGAVSPRPAVAALARAATQAVTSGVWLRSAGLGLSAAALLVGVALGLPGRSPPSQPQQKEMPGPKNARADSPAAKPPEEAHRTLTGKVVDPSGQPVAGAEIIHLPIDGQPTVAGKTDAAGAFRITVPLKSPGAWLFARAAGFASDFLMPATNTPAEHTFKLVKDTPIRGRLVGTEGKPIAGASVALISIQGTEESSLDAFLAGWLKRDAAAQGIPLKGQVSFGDVVPRKLPDGRAVFSAITGADGRFEITNVGAERLVTLSVRGKGIAFTHPMVITRAGFDPAPYNQSSREKIRQDGDYGLGYHPSFHAPAADIVVEAEKPIRGVVKETDTGKPLAGVQVVLQQGWRMRLPDATAVTDAAGRYEIHGAMKAATYELLVHRDVKTGLLGRTVKAGDTTGFEPVIADIGLAKGIVLSGRVLDTSTGKSVPGFACVGILVDNKFVNSRPEYSSPDCYDFANTDKDGVFHTVVPPGPVLLMGGPHPSGGGNDVYFKYQQLKPDPDYPQYFDPSLSGFRSPGGVTTVMQGMYCKVLNLKPDQKEVTADVLLKRASEFHVKVQDASGKPVAKVVVAGTTSRDWMYAEDVTGDTCVVYDLENAKPRLLAFYAPESGQVGTLTLSGRETDPAVVKLGPGGTVKGRVVNSAGQPIARLRLLVSHFDRVADQINQRRRGGDFEQHRESIETDADGKFEIPGVMPGMKFLIYGRRAGRYLEPPKTSRDAGYTAKPGETTDLGTITMKEQ